MELKEQEAPGPVIGILGGMGPEATLDLYRCIINLTPARRDQDHIRVMIYSNPKIPDRTKAIAAGGESPLPQLIESAQLLQNSGAGIIVMPCNAAHHYLPEVRRRIQIPFLDMIEETARKIRVRLPNAGTVGLMASIGTCCSGVYARSMAGAGIEIKMPDYAEQQKVEAAINQVKAGIHDRSTRETFQSIGRQLMDNGAEAVILGCTEIPLAFDSAEVAYPTLNPTEILAAAAVDWALGRRSAAASGCPPAVLRA